MNQTPPRRAVLLLAFALLALGGAAVFLDASFAGAGGHHRPAAAEDGTVVMPERFLRAWDPLTIYFEEPTGPRAAGPEPKPERYASLTPSHPGAWRWLDRRTLQFRPADPWPPLGALNVSVDQTLHRRHTLMSPPRSTQPRAGAEALEPVSQISLEFPVPIDLARLAKMIRVELRPLPGLDAAQARWLGAADWTLKVLDRRRRDDAARYELSLREPIPFGTRATVHLRLSTEDDAEEGFHRFSFATAAPFRVRSLGCHGRVLPGVPEGVRYGASQALRCTGGRRLEVELTAEPKALPPVLAANFVRVDPPVEGLGFRLRGRRIRVTGPFEEETAYRLSLSPVPLEDRQGRRLEQTGEISVPFFFPAAASYFKVRESDLILEQRGPKRVPIETRGHRRVDLRIHPLDPLDRNTWPLAAPLRFDESRRPPGPGETTPPHDSPTSHIAPGTFAARIPELGTPALSEVVELPTRGKGAARFGLDLESILSKVQGQTPPGPGHYLLGLRPLDGSTQRHYLRLQLSDLSLTTVEEVSSVRFYVTSIHEAEPVRGAEVRVEGWRTTEGETRWVTFFSGRSDRDGSVRWTPNEDHWRAGILRVVVQKGDDVLVLDPQRRDEHYANGRWSQSGGSWLSWTLASHEGRGEQPQTLCHMFSERPVYRPEHTVHIKGWRRVRHRGRLTPEGGGQSLVVVDPGGRRYEYDVSLDPQGAFYQAFAEEKLPTGAYQAWLEGDSGTRCGHVSFRMEAYRPPRFEVRIAGPGRAALDRPFELRADVGYYAGGPVVDRPVRWRVTAFPHRHRPPGHDAYLFASDSRFSPGRRFGARAALDRAGRTDAQGSDRIVINPALEADARPRRYVVEATVTGADEQTVTAVREVFALPPFSLGLSLPRHLERAERIEPKLLAIGPDGEPVPELEVELRLLRREWHASLRAADFRDGQARYDTETVDRELSRQHVETTAGPRAVSLPVEGAGVYVVEISARDRLGRTQVVAADLFIGGSDAVSWRKPATPVFEVSSDKDRYAPDETAHLVLQSPFQEGRALAIIEAPEGPSYRWLEVEGGKATFGVKLDAHYAPRVPVHFLLSRGRGAFDASHAARLEDLTRPRSFGATKWLEVLPEANRVEIHLAHPEKARPGETIELEVRLADAKGRPVSGEVTLWLVDRAVLALGKEARLDPLPDFLRPARSYLQLRDTRNRVPGAIPFAELPGGDGDSLADAGLGNLLDRVTVRRNFSAVPYYEPSLRVGKSGSRRVKVKLSDDLTTFAIRAKAVAGPERFGAARSKIEVRLPVLVQPALPRFVRPGDSFIAAAVARVVDGKGGAAHARLKAEGLEVPGLGEAALMLSTDEAMRVRFPVKVQTPEFGEDGSLARESVNLELALLRKGDGAADAFAVSLPLVDDRPPQRRRTLHTLLSRGSEVHPIAGEPAPVVRTLELAGLPEKARPGSVRRRLLVSSEASLAPMAVGLDLLLEYPHGCTEQRVSRARAQLALRELREVFGDIGGRGRELGPEALEASVRETLDWLDKAVGDGGLAGYWPGGRRYVGLTAWVLHFLVEARDAGYPVDSQLYGRVVRALRASLRSDASRFVDGEDWYERTAALGALTAAGEGDAGYAAELTRKSHYLGLESRAEVLLALHRGGEASEAGPGLAKGIYGGVVFRLHQGQEIYGGLQRDRRRRSPLVLPSETRTLAALTRALGRQGPTDPKLRRLVTALIGLGRGDGWGSTQANAAAILALTERLKPPFADAPEAKVALFAEDEAEPLARFELGETDVTSAWLDTEGAALKLEHDGGAPVSVLSELEWRPAALGSDVAADSRGFVVTRARARLDEDGKVLERTTLEAPGETLPARLGEVFEERLTLVNPKARHFVAVVLPLAAGLEALNPALATAPPEARPSRNNSIAPTYAAWRDDAVTWYFDALPKGSFDFYLRTRATTEGSFVQPPARAEAMYDDALRGRSPGATVQVGATEAE